MEDVVRSLVENIDISTITGQISDMAPFLPSSLLLVLDRL